MRLIDVDDLIDDCKRYLATLNPDRDGKECTRIHWLIGILNNAPSAQLEERTEECTETHACDLISRQDAFEAIFNEPLYESGMKERTAIAVVLAIYEKIKSLPPAQPDLDQWCTDCKEYDSEKHHCPRFNRVIREALKDSEPEPCEDTVSREDAIRWVKTECNPYGKPTLDFESGKKVIEYLKRMPPVTPKRKPGKWSVYDRHTIPYQYICSERGAYHRARYDFCPSCGADTRGEQNDTE